jgi:hypothetical protein
METPSPAVAASVPRRRFHFRLVPTIFVRPRRAYAEIVHLERPSWLTPLLILSLATLLPVLAAGRVRQQAGAFGPESLPPDFQFYSPEHRRSSCRRSSRRSPTFVSCCRAWAL